MITVRLFASLSDAAGQAVFTVSGPVKGTTKAADLFADLTARHPRLGAFRERAKVAVNETYADWDAAVSDGDEVAFFPPVSGGRW